MRHAFLILGLLLLLAAPVRAEMPRQWLMGTPLIGWFETAPNNELTDFPEEAAAGNNYAVALIGTVTMLNDEAVTVMDALLDRAEGHLGVFVEIPREEVKAVALGPQPPGDAEWAAIDRYLDAFANDDRVIGWYAFDEPDQFPHLYANPQILHWLADRIRARGGKPIMIVFSHCALVDCWGTGPIDVSRFTGAADIFMFDNFPYTTLTSPQTVDAAAPFLLFRRHVRGVEELPTLFSSQAFGLTQGPSPHSLPGRDVTFAEARFQAWNGMLMGGQGVNWFAHMFSPVEMREAIFNPLSREVADLAPVLSGADFTDLVGLLELSAHSQDEEFRVSLPVQFALRQAAGDSAYYAFLSNPSPRPTTVQLNLSALRKGWFLERLELGQTVESWSDPDGRVNIPVAAYGVVILRLS